MKKIIIIASAAIILFGGAGVWFFAPDLLPGHSAEKDSAHGKGAKAQEKKHEPEAGVDLDVFVVNLGSGTNRYLRTILSLGVASEHEKEKIKEFSGPIRDAVIMYLTEKKVEELTDPEGKNKIRGDLLKQINTAIGHQMVRNVYFKEFLIQ